MEFTWTGDVASGVLKNHALSAKIREAAIAKTKFLQFVDTEPGYGKRKGDSLTLTRIRNIAVPTTGQITEADRIPIDAYAQSSITVTVSEWGRGVEYTHLADLLAHYDIADKIQRKLRQQLQLVLDGAGAAAFKTAKVCFIPTSLGGGVFDTDGTPSTQATQNLTVAHVKTIRDYFMDTIHAPGWRGGEEYMCLASTKACRGVRNDPEFIEANKYVGNRDWFANGEIGKIENVRIVEVNNTAALANNKGLASVLGEAVFFGEDAVTMAVAEDPELRAAIPADFGRQKAVAWYGVLAFTIVWDTANDGEARIIRLTSS